MMNHSDGRVSLEVSPLLAHDTAGTIAAAKELFTRAGRRNLFIKIPGTKNPQASDILYIKALASPFTVNTMPEGTLKVLADHGDIGPIMAADGGDCEKVLAQLAQAGVNVDSLAAQLQDEGAKSFVKSWNELLAVIASKSAALKQAI